MGLRKGSALLRWEISFEVSEGDLPGISDPNGAGKTTIVRMLACLRFEGQRVSADSQSPVSRARLS
jgi:ABC-type Na+ transport system ATPase subunit NatA